MSTIKSTSEQIELIHRVAGSVVGDCIPNLMELLHYRKELAQAIVQNGHLHINEYAHDMYKHTNDLIKKLLGL